jgi:hypothetical protein
MRLSPGNAGLTVLPGLAFPGAGVRTACTRGLFAIFRQRRPAPGAKNSSHGSAGRSVPLALYAKIRTRQNAY